jgi:hypothetical protein
VPVSDELYRRVAIRGWQDLRDLSDAAIVAYFRLRTGPESSMIPGVAVTRRAAFAEALHWKPAKTNGAIEELVARNVIVADWEAPLVWIPQAALDGGPENPNQVTGWRRYWSLVPDCDLKVRVRMELRAMLEPRRTKKGETFVATFDEACPNVTPKVAETGSGSGRERKGRGGGKGTVPPPTIFKSQKAVGAERDAVEVALTRCSSARLASRYALALTGLELVRLREELTRRPPDQIALVPVAYELYLESEGYAASGDRAHGMRWFIGDLDEKWLPAASKAQKEADEQAARIRQQEKRAAEDKEIDALYPDAGDLLNRDRWRWKALVAELGLEGAARIEKFRGVQRHLRPDGAAAPQAPAQAGGQA